MVDKIREVYDRALEIPFDDSARFVFMSDCHRSDGSQADNFISNANIYCVALQQYYRQGFTYVELGDGDELWANKSFSDIAKATSPALEMLHQFYSRGRLLMLYGNHDMVKRRKKWAEKNLTSYLTEYGEVELPLFPGITVHEALVLSHREKPCKIFLLHGHQVDPLNSTWWKLSRWLVRYVWRPLEIIGVQDPTSPVNNRSRKMDIEEVLKEYAQAENRLVIAGHTHRKVFPEPGQSPYFNDGCCVYPHFITAIELAEGALSLVKWLVQTKEDGGLYVGRLVLKGPVRLSDYYEKEV